MVLALQRLERPSALLDVFSYLQTNIHKTYNITILFKRVLQFTLSPRYRSRI
jgi:hypothetical protein